MNKKTYFISVSKVLVDYYEIDLTDEELNDINNQEDKFDIDNFVQENAHRNTGETAITEIKIEEMYPKP